MYMKLAQRQTGLMNFVTHHYCCHIVVMKINEIHFFLTVKATKWISMGNMVTNDYVKSNYDPLHIDKALGILKNDNNNNNNNYNSSILRYLIIVLLQIFNSVPVNEFLK